MSVALPDYCKNDQGTPGRPPAPLGCSRVIHLLHGYGLTETRAVIKDGYIYITGRIKEIIVMAKGEKVPTANIETAIKMDPLIDQAIVIGAGKPHLAALVVINKEVNTLYEGHGL